ncbi:hypothetical protein CEXT_714591 [Caerostris extrusa]|uniref:Uncharacterized protein n=1 Tax=Caerostris extrusa TaxID=172846 RepID=A0AAV4PKN0_CAEEX|nr:hypothetical protein CEXT_714591 [Caerostris extrusa]
MSPVTNLDLVRNPHHFQNIGLFGPLHPQTYSHAEMIIHPLWCIRPIIVQATNTLSSNAKRDAQVIDRKGSPKVVLFYPCNHLIICSPVVQAQSGKHLPVIAARQLLMRSNCRSHPSNCGPVVSGCLYYSEVAHLPSSSSSIGKGWLVEDRAVFLAELRYLFKKGLLSM